MNNKRVKKLRRRRELFRHGREERVQTLRGRPVGRRLVKRSDLRQTEKQKCVTATTD